MPWIRNNKRQHFCNIPRHWEHKPYGSIWQCRKCSRMWIIRYNFPLDKDIVPYNNEGDLT